MYKRPLLWPGRESKNLEPLINKSLQLIRGAGSSFRLRQRPFLTKRFPVTLFRSTLMLEGTLFIPIFTLVPLRRILIRAVMTQDWAFCWYIDWYFYCVSTIWVRWN